MLEQEEDEGDLEEEAWKSGLGSLPRRQPRTLHHSRAAGSPPAQACSGNSSAFPSYLQGTPSLGEARLQRIGQRCAATLVMFCFGGKISHLQPTPHVPGAHSSDRASCRTGLALLGGKQRGPNAAESAREMMADIHVCRCSCVLQRDTSSLFEKDLMPNWK